MAGNQLRYPCCFNDFVKDLQQQHDKLTKTRNAVEDYLQNSKSQVLDLPVVHAWLKHKANPLRGNVEKLLKQVETRTNKTRCYLRCPNWIWRYQMANKLAKKKVEVQTCIEEGDAYIKVERLVSSADTQNLPLEKPLEFDSRKGAYNKLLEALKNDDITRVGLHGMGGCGKTTMALQLKKTAESERLFSEVHFVTVSNNIKLEVRSIQDRIAKAAQVIFKRDEENERAKDLRTRLSLENKKILLILDDVWKELDFGAIGIPSPENCKNFKVLITTRSGEVCDSMKCQGKIFLPTLTDEEGWDLFQKQAHISEGTSEALIKLGRQISNECKGLPVAIAALAGTLKGKLVEKDWQEALNRLKSSISVDIEENLQNPYNCLQVSYDNLDTTEAKSLLLLCSVFPEDYEILVENLTIIAIGLGLVGEFRSFEEARKKVSAAKNKLISSSLLLSDDVDEGKHVKMHDLVRDVAIWIASKDNKTIKCLMEESVTLECSSICYLWCKKFPNELNCSGIEFLYMETCLEVSNEIFKAMGRLRVLYLWWRGIGRGQLSTVSLQSLTNLRCLILSSWKLGDISIVGHMTKLECLALLDCLFFELPDVVATQLTNLRLLQLTNCGIERNPLEVIGRQPQLEELYYDNRNQDELSKMFVFPKALRRYGIILGSKFSDHRQLVYNGHVSLCLSCFDTSNAILKGLAIKAEVLHVASITGGGKNIIPDIFPIEGGEVTSYGWIDLCLRDSEGIECLVDNTDHILFSKLRKLRIDWMKQLGALYRGVPPHSGLFERLEQLYITSCPVLTCLFTPEVARTLVRLEELVISSCDGMKHLLADNEREDKDISRNEHGPVFSKLKEIEISDCGKMEYIIPVSFARGLVQLKSLLIIDCPELNCVFGRESIGGDQIQNEVRIELPALEKLRLESNPKMMSIFPSYCSVTWPLLREFQLWFCGKFDIMSVNTFKSTSSKKSRIWDASTIEKHFLTSKSLSIWDNSKIESIFNLDKLVNNRKPVNLRLESMDLLIVYEMKYICMGGKDSFTFQNLKKLQIRECNRLVVVFPASVVRFLPELQNLEIRECKELKQVVEDDYVEISTKPCFPKLVVLCIIKCHSLKRVSASNNLPKLELLFIKGAEKLQEIIGCEKGESHDEDIGKVKVELPALNFMVLWELSNLCQGIGFPTAATCVVRNCPKFPFTSSIATLKEFRVKERKYRDWLSYSSSEKLYRVMISHAADIGVENFEGSIIQKLFGETETTIKIPQRTEDKVKKSVQDVSTSMGTTKTIMDKKSAIACADTCSRQSMIVVQLGVFKDSADLNDAQIDLLAEAIALYPHLWEGLDKFSMRYQALMLKTLSDMLFFLQNESPASVTPQQEREFIKLCDEALQLGFDKSWVEEMRQRVLVTELLNMHDQLSQELSKLKVKIDKLHYFVDSPKKCFDFR